MLDLPMIRRGLRGGKRRTWLAYVAKHRAEYVQACEEEARRPIVVPPRFRPVFLHPRFA